MKKFDLQNGDVIMNLKDAAGTSQLWKPVEHFTENMYFPEERFE